MAHNETYKEFLAKFVDENKRHKKNTDDCYTPPQIFEVVEQWVRENSMVDISNLKTIRPFFPNGDYQSENYEGCVVIDNPPFSIISQIAKFYTEKNIPFFLFAPALTTGSIALKNPKVSIILTDSKIRYENGVKIMTGFISNLFGDTAIMLAPDLHRKIYEKQGRKDVKHRNSISHPNVYNVATLQKYIDYRNGQFKIKRKECAFTHSVGHNKTAMFGRCILVGNHIAEKISEWNKQRVCEIELTEDEKKLIQTLSK